MHLGIGRVIELTGLPPAMGLHQLIDLGDHTCSHLRGRRQYNLRAEEADHAASLETEIFRHNDH